MNVNPQMMKNKRFLVTGGAGFIGSNFIKFLLKKHRGSTVLNYDKLTYAGNIDNLSSVCEHPDYSFVKGDICDKRTLTSTFRGFDADYVINFAAESHVDRSIISPEEFIKTNVLGVQNLLKLSSAYEAEKYLQISTDEVYGTLGEKGYFTEETSLDPHSPYAASKAAGDLLTMAHYNTHSLPVNISRCSNNYGPYQFPEKLIPLTILNCISGRPTPVYGDGRNVRDWIHVEDHCTALYSVIERGKIGEVYNIGGNNERRNIDVVKLIIGGLASRLPDSKISENLIEYVEDRKGHDYRYATDTKKIRKLGWEPDIGFEDGIQKTIDWYLANRKWVESAANKKNFNPIKTVPLRKKRQKK
jgi:dTDP-glucose 4,6-dehydratase